MEDGPVLEVDALGESPADGGVGGSALSTAKDLIVCFTSRVSRPGYTPMSFGDVCTWVFVSVVVSVVVVVTCVRVVRVSVNRKGGAAVGV